MFEPSRCPTCGEPAPCGCDGGKAEAGAARQFTLLQPDPGQGVVEEEERFTRLLREVKAKVVERPFVTEDEAGPLLRRVRQLGRLIEDGKLPDADDAAQDALGQVLEFPKPPRRAFRRLSVVIAVILGILAVGLFLWL